jgi:hypothetical protein
MKCILSTIFSVLCALFSQSQVSNYTFSQSTGVYTPISGGANYNNFTTWSNTNFLDDNISAALESIGFNFVYNGVIYTQFGVSTNGFITLGNLPTNTDYFPLSTGPSNNVISAMGGDLIGRGSLKANRTPNNTTITIVGGDINQILVGDKVSGTGITSGATVVSKTANTVVISSPTNNTTGNGFHLRFSRSTFGIRFQTIGTSPNRTLVVQWTGWQRFTTGLGGEMFGELYNFQIRLNETTNTINFIYDVLGPTSTITTTFQIGLKGLSSDFNNRTTTTNWSSTSSGTTSSSSITLSNSVKPISGLTYTWTPPSNALPVEMLYFTGYGYSSYNILKWSTASEHNSDYFSIQRSQNGYDWKEVGQKTSAGNSTIQTVYSYTDYYNNDGFIYYKLIQYDLDGNFKQYGPVDILFHKKTKDIVKYVNILGQEVNPYEVGIIFEVYDDGTISRTFK